MGVIYTDLSGQGYDLPALTAAWNDPSFRSDPANARVGDILAGYGAPGAQAAPAPAPSGGPPANLFAAPPPTTAPNSSVTSQTFTNTSPTKPSLPTGIPGQTMTTPSGQTVQYDTAGYIMGTTYNEGTGQLTIPNPVTGKTSTSYVNPLTGATKDTSSVPAANWPTPTDPFGVSSVKTPTTTGGGGAGGAGGGGSAPPQIDKNFVLGIFGNPPTLGTPPPFSYPGFQGPGPFSAPSAADVLNNDPGYQFRLGQGTQALEQSAAARGVLNTGGTLQDLINYGQNAASQEYQPAYDRALNTYQTNFNNQYNPWLAGATNALNAYNTNYSTQYQNPYNALMQQYIESGALQGQLFTQAASTKGTSAPA